MSDWDEKRAEVGPGCYEGEQQSHKIQIAITKIMKIDFPKKGKELKRSKMLKNHEIERLFTIWDLNGCCKPECQSSMQYDDDPVDGILGFK